MQLMKLLHKMFQKELPFVHKVRLNNVMEASSALIRSNKLTLTSLGRNLPSHVETRSNIKKIDRLLGNKHLQNESNSFYKMMSHSLISMNSKPWIHVDWCCLCSTTGMYLLRASLSMRGRSIVIYEECHPKSKENNHAIHKDFLKKLKAVLPITASPVIVTDAGFRGTWFAHIKHIGWDFVGRLRNKNAVKLNGLDSWVLSKSLYQGATSKPNCLGQGLLTKTGKVPVSFVLYKGKKPNRKSYRTRSRCYGASRGYYIRGSKEPWLLVTSLNDTDTAKTTINIYRQRMQIEENFRDTKCTRYGFGLKESRTRTDKRMKILVLIAAITTFACWLASIIAKQRGCAPGYQARSSKYTNALSSVYLGKEVLRQGVFTTLIELKYALKSLFEVAAKTRVVEIA